LYKGTANSPRALALTVSAAALSPRLHERSELNRKYALVAWLSLIGALLPSRELGINAGVNFTPGRICIILLFFPALLNLLSKSPRLTWSDFFAFATVAWILVAACYTKGAEALLSAAGGESLEFLGAYMVGRAFLWRPAALQNFVHVLKIVTIILVLFALADRISGRWIIENTLASLVHVVPAGANYRNGVIRATASLDHPILLGAFLSLASALFIYSKESAVSRGSCLVSTLFGCFLSLSSVSLMAWGMIVGAYLYDRLLSTISWRWGLFWAVMCSLACVVFMVTNAPLGWIITHLTLDPESGYFRYLIWDAALERIPESPYVGFAFSRLNDEILDTTVDSVWLVYALRFGVPMISFLFLTNVCAIWPARRTPNDLDDATFLIRMNTAFTIMLLIFMFIGLTVHYWNYMWIFWGLCLGIKVSLKQNLSVGRRVTLPGGQRAMRHHVTRFGARPFES
jgi:hypothetical protein